MRAAEQGPCPGLWANAQAKLEGAHAAGLLHLGSAWLPAAVLPCQGCKEQLCARRSHLMSDKENAPGLEPEDLFKFYAFQRQNVPEAFPEFHKDTPSGKGGAKGLQVLHCCCCCC